MEGEQQPLLAGKSEGQPDDHSDKAWYSRPSHLWLLPGIFLIAVVLGATFAPRIEVYTLLVCRDLPPQSMIIQPFDSISSSLDQGPANPWVPSWLIAGAVDAERCRHDPRVQARVAFLQTAMTLTMGILSALTTGYYGGLSDRHGRTPVLTLSLCGMTISDTVFLLTTNYADTLTYRFLLVGPVIDGLVGGIATAQAAMNGYISDSSPAGSRAHTFSIVTGFLFAGVGVGPTLGGLLIKATNNVLSPFYVSISVGLTFALLTFFALLESLSRARQMECRRTHALAVQHLKEEAKVQTDTTSSFQLVVKNRLKRSLTFLQPLMLFFPRRIDQGHPEGVHILKQAVTDSQGREWSLTLLAMAYGLYNSMMAIYGTKMLYSQYKFGWSSIELGYVLTLAGGSRVLFMVLILPVIIKFCRRNPPKRSTETDQVTSVEEEELAAGVGDADMLAHELHKSKVLHDSHFDLWLARCSIAVDVMVYIALTFNANATQFLIFTGLQALGGGAAPAMQSLALSLVSPQDSGKLFAGLSVLQTLMTQIIGPLGFGVLYATTLHRFAETIFAVGATLFGISFALLLCIRLRSRNTVQMA